MGSHEAIQLEIEQPARTRTITVGGWFRHIFILDELPGERHYRPVFTLVMSVLHVLIHLTIFIGVLWHGPRFGRRLTNLGMLFVPCMKPASPDVLMTEIRCPPWRENNTCHYDDTLRSRCFSFLYPHQLWRVFTVNLLHGNGLHLFFNMLKQLLYGIALERKYGSARVALVYWLADVGASLMVMLLDAHMCKWKVVGRRASVVMFISSAGIGASGALYGLLVFFVVERLIAMKRQTGRRLLILAQLGILVAAPLIITMSLANFLGYRIGHKAHFGGGLVGGLLGIGMLAGQGHALCRCAAFAALAIYCTLTLTIFFLTDAPFVG